MSSISTEDERSPPRSSASMGLDPVSSNGFGEIIDAERDARDYGRPPKPYSAARRKRDQFSRATWVMIVIAGILLGVAMAMMAAG